MKNNLNFNKNYLTLTKNNVTGSILLAAVLVTGSIHAVTFLCYVAKYIVTLPFKTVVRKRNGSANI